MPRDEYAPIVQRSPIPLPENPEELSTYLEGEISRIWSAIQAVSAGHFPKMFEAPPRPRDGDVRYADGTSWDPGAGEGAYIYYGATWNKLG